jgi:uncharacterized membrane protein
LTFNQEAVFLRKWGSQFMSQLCFRASPQPIAAATTSIGLKANGAGALAYLAGILTAILFLIIETYKSDRFVRFHAFQSILFNVAWAALWIAWMIVGMLLGAVTRGLFFLLQAPIDLLLMAGGFALWAFLMFTAYQGKMTRLPWIGALAARQA